MHAHRQHSTQIVKEILYNLTIDEIYYFRYTVIESIGPKAVAGFGSPGRVHYAHRPVYKKR